MTDQREYLSARAWALRKRDKKQHRWRKRRTRGRPKRA